MKKFIITEIEKKRIMGLYEKVGEKLPPDRLSSLKAKYTKEIANLLNQFYDIKLTSADNGDWWSKEYNDTLKKFMEENNLPVWICKKGDGYCDDDQEGEVTTKGDIKSALNKALINKSKTTEKINTTNDKTYDYNLSNG